MPVSLSKATNYLPMPPPIAVPLNSSDDAPLVPPTDTANAMESIDVMPVKGGDEEGLKGSTPPQKSQIRKVAGGEVEATLIVKGGDVEYLDKGPTPPL